MARTVFALINGKMSILDKPKNPEKANFVIVCDYGDWSGFRTLAECKKQFLELENKNKGNFYYRVEER